MKRLSLISILILSAFPLSGHANGILSLDQSECTPVDLRPQLSPINDQGPSGWCYAHTLADIIGQSLKKPISGNAIALDYIRSGHSAVYIYGSKVDERKMLTHTWPLIFGKDFKFAGGDFRGPFALLKKSGVCQKSKFNEPNMNAWEDFERIYQVKKEADSLKGMIWTTKKEKTAIFEKIKSTPCFQNLIHNIFPEAQIDNVINVIMNSSQENVISDIAKSACRPKISLANINLEITDKVEGNITTIPAEVTNGLLAGKIVGIAYNVDFMHNMAPSNVANHASTIVGQRWNPAKDRCELLIRDSHGPKCMRDGKYLLRKNFKCEKGYVWAGREEVLSSIVQTAVVK